MKPLLITGATGFVGRSVLLRATSAGTPVWAPVRDQQKLFRQLEEDSVPRELVTALSTDPRDWPAAGAGRAVLCAGVLFARSRQEYFQTNVDWNLAVLRALPSGCPAVVLSSQSAGGPTPRGRFARTEADPDAPITWYGESKLELECAIGREFPNRPVTILRPPMILGARDTATLPLFKMAGGTIRTKPGLKSKSYSFLGVGDVVSAVEAAFSAGARGPFYIAGEAPISDLQLLASAARAAGGRGFTLPVPQALVRVIALVVDAVPSLRKAVPSLTRDRSREIWPDRWVIDAEAFRKATGWHATAPLDRALQEACDWLRGQNLLIRAR